LGQEAPAPDPGVVRQAQCNKQCRDSHAGAYESAKVQSAGGVDTCSCVGSKGETLAVYRFAAGRLVDLLSESTPTRSDLPLCPSCSCSPSTSIDTDGIKAALWVLTGLIAVEVGIQLYYLGK